ncbi:MAG: methylated-DNA--[protein]-cysteine S-methyltransferase [Enterobacterales bacterium]|nr:methylated-DNA--[protein]-cysteine S-methyltransferase [Enterobacterales bacterium]
MQSNNQQSTVFSKATLPPNKVMYQALVNKDTQYEGIFVAGIKTTGIFCRPSCSARKPKEENVEYFGNSQQALSFGYRPCKICHPLEPLGNTPQWIKDLLKEIENLEQPRLKDQDLRQRGIEPAKLRRWFKKHHAMTFQAYLRGLRLNRAMGQIQAEQPILDVALDVGYQSLSGFSEAFKKLTGVSPKSHKQQQKISVTRLLTPLGPMIAAATERGVCLLEFIDRRGLETQFQRLTRRLNAHFVPGDETIFKQLAMQMQHYFNGHLNSFNLPLDLVGTEFQKKVWRSLIQIPCGETRSYQQQAIHLGNAKSVRAVAKANGDNAIAIIIPCHRVIGKDGKLVGYAGGLWRKQRLLELERAGNW